MSQVNQEPVADVSQESQARAIVYNLLSSLFAKEVTAELVEQLTSEQGQSFLNTLALEPSLSPSINEINGKLSQLNSKESLLELAADFCGLFLVDGRTCASPYAGQYLGADKNVKKKSDRPQIFGELHQKMTEFLTENKLQIHSDFPEPGDHIAVILAYVAHLCVTASTKEQLTFIDSYLLSWLGDFTEQVNKHDNDNFYSAVANLTLQWLTIDMEALQGE